MMARCGWFFCLVMWLCLWSCTGGIPVMPDEQPVVTKECEQDTTCQQRDARSVCVNNHCRCKTPYRWCSAHCDQTGTADTCRCIDVLTDTEHCGTCGQRCDSKICCGGTCCALGTVCCGDACCSAGQSCCGGKCVVMETDPQHCGACGQTCTSGKTCCGGQCVNTQENVSHCGGCRQVCPTESCCGGNCCPAGRICCASGCIDTRYDAQHCGSCGQTCNSGEICCKGVCVNPQSMEHCGGCGQRCSGAIPSQTQSQTIRGGMERTLSFVFKELPKVLDTDEIEVTVEIFGDFAESDKYAEVAIAGEVRERIRGDEPACNWTRTPSHTGRYRVASSLLLTGSLTVEVALSPKVSLTECASVPARVVVALSYGGRVCCNQQCVQSKTEAKHCGTCGQNCASGVCCAGKCCQNGEQCSDGACFQTMGPVDHWVYQMAFTPSQQFLVAATSGGGLLIDLQKKATVATFHQKPQINVLSVAVHPQGKRLATASTDGLVQMWDLPTVTTPQIIHTYKKSATGVVFSPDGKWLASCSAEGKLHLWDSISGQLVWEYAFGGAEMTALAFHPQGQSIVVHAGYTFLLVLDLQGIVRKVVNMARYSSTNILSFALRPDGQQVAVGMWSQEIHILDLSTYNPVKVLLNPGLPQYINYDSNGKYLAVGANNKAVWVWNAATFQIQQALFGHASAVTSVQFQPQSRLLASGSAADTHLRLWNLLLP